jgi:hypothetical protein
MMSAPAAAPRSEGSSGFLPLTRCRSLAKLAEDELHRGIGGGFDEDRGRLAAA